MIRKLLVLVAAVLVNCALLAGLHGWSTAAAAHAKAAPRTESPVVLPTMTVRPTPAQIEMLRRAPWPSRPARPAKEARDGSRA